MSQATALVFSEEDLQPQTLPVTIAGKSYTLYEATEGAAVQYRNAIMRTAKFADGSFVGTEGNAGAVPYLVHLCLKDDKGNQVGINQVNSWPSRVIRPMYDWIRQVSQLEEGESAERKAAIAVFSREDSPIDLANLRAWLDEKSKDPALKTEFRAFIRLVEEQADAKK